MATSKRKSSANVQDLVPAGVQPIAVAHEILDDLLTL
jgi:hypothetical protein